MNIKQKKLVKNIIIPKILDLKLKTDFTISPTINKKVKISKDEKYHIN